MNKKLTIMGMAIGLAALLTVSLGTTVFADAGDTTSPAAECGSYARYGGNGYGESAEEAIAELLGLTTEELQDLRLEGYSLAEIAETNGVSLDELVAVMMEAKTESIQARVAEGTLTQERAELMLQQMEQRTVQMANRTQTGPAEWRGGSGMGGNSSGSAYRMGGSGFAGAGNRGGAGSGTRMGTCLN